MNLASPPSRRDITFAMSRALEFAPAIEVLQWRSADNSTYQLQVCYQGDSPTWLLRKTDEDPPQSIWRLVTEDPEHVYRLLLKKSSTEQSATNAAHATSSGQHQTYVADGGGLQPVTDGTIFLDRYKILGPIAQGGMGVVYKGIDLTMERDVAVKVLQSRLADNDNARQRFEMEMQSCINFKHPNIVSVFDYGYSPQNLAYMVMEYCPGKTLDEYMESVKTLDIETFVKVFSQVCSALGYAHDKMVIHRDVKPKNIVLVEHGDNMLVKLLDFGIAKGSAESNNTLQKLTQTGDALGSPFYMSPEQCKSVPLDGRSDIYSLGCVMYQAVSGRVPFNGANALTTILMHINDRCPPFSMLHAGLKIPNGLEQIILHCLEKNPNDRYQTARQVSESLQQFLELYHQGSTNIDWEEPNIGSTEDAIGQSAANAERSVGEPPSFAAQQILRLLTIAGIIKTDDVEAAMKLQLWHGGDPTQYLVELGCIDTRTHRSATQCLGLMERFSLSPSDAALTLKYCFQRGISIEEALAELE